MKRTTLATTVILLTLGVSPARASITYVHDETKLQQFLLTQTGIGRPWDTLDGRLWYAMHSSYKKRNSSQLPVNGKEYQRMLALEEAFKEKKYAEDNDSLMTHRAKEEALTVADKGVNDGGADLIWPLEGPKIERALLVFKQNISALTSAGATNEDMEYWNGLYETFVEETNVIRTAYIANSKRGVQYTRIYNDITEANDKIYDFAVYLRSRGMIEPLLITAKFQKLRKKRVIDNALHRWRSARWKTVVETA